MVQRGTILYSTFSSEAIQQLVLPHYEIGHSAECTLFNRGLNDTYQVRANGAQFALRLYRSRWRDREAITQELATLLHLRAKGIPLAAPIARSDGEFITQLAAPEGTRHAALFHWVHGEQPRYINPTHARLHGAVAARLHIAGDDLSSNRIRRLDADFLLEQPVTQLRPAFARHPSSAARFEALVERTRRRLEQAREQLLDWGLCHGDMHFGNAHVEGDQLRLFDFDLCGPGWRIYDLATYRWAARLRNVEQRAWKPFIEAYQELRHVTAGELELVPLFVLLRHIWLQGYHAWDAVEAGSSYQTEPYFEQFVAFCERCESEPDQQP